METGYITKTSLLTYDPTIYWLHPIWQVEWRISRHAFRAARFDVRGQARKNLTYDLEQEAKQRQWGRYTWHDEEHSTEYGDVVIRRMVYLQPGFRRIEQWAGPDNVQTIKIMRRNDQARPGDPVETQDIQLHRLWYRGWRARGALLDDVLYVVFDR